MGHSSVLGRIKSEYATIQPVPLRICAVSFADVRGIRHTVEVQAESLFEAAILGVRTFRGDPWIEHIGPATVLDIEVREPATTSVTDEAQRRGAASRIREALNPEPGVPALTGPQSASVLQDTTSHRADTGYAWGWLIHGLLEHAMRKKEASRADLERLAGWLVVEFPDLRPFIAQAVDVVEGVFGAAFWQQARVAAECQVEVPFAARSDDSSGVSTVVRGVIDLVYAGQSGWRIVDYKTDQAVDAGLMVKYANQVADYGTAWSRVTSGTSPQGSIFLVRTGRIVDLEAGTGTSDS
jgi:ATP-dependent exoDNAse (exonuclease V) beta subunit